MATRYTWRRILKSFLYGVASLVVLPVLVLFYLKSLVIGRGRALTGSSQTLSLVPGLCGQYLRRAFYVRTLDRCHRSATIEFGVLFSKAGARLGSNVYIGPGCQIGLAEIGDDTLIAAGVHIPSGPRTHGTDQLGIPIREQSGELRRVNIGKGCWIGSTAIVMADVGDESVVAAGSVVVDSLPARVIAAGVPARVVRARESSDT